MNVEKLEVGKVFKNHKELCLGLEMEFKIGTNSRKSQIRELSHFCRFKKHGQSFTIEEVFHIPLEKVYSRVIKIPLAITNPLMAADY